ncbi:MAG: InlB B-repeat-containing protein [Eubacteriales bacterium]
MTHIKHAAAAIVVAVTLVIALTILLPAGAAEPVHKASNEYLVSQYYANLRSLELTGDQRTDVVLVALTQLGYHEGDSDADMGGGNKSGRRNFVEYNRLFGKVDNSEGNGVSYGYEWCASFSTWCVRQAGVPASVLKNEVSCIRLIAWLRENSTYITRTSGYIPRTGDLIFFKASDSQKEATHVGLVRYVSGGTVYTIEGNTSTQNVSLRSYSLKDTYIVGYGVPAYASNPSRAIDFSMSDGYLPGTYFINTATLNVRRGPSTSHEIAGSLYFGEKVTLLDHSENWGRISFGGGDGWIYLGYAHYVPSARYTIYYNTNGGEGIVPAQPKADGADAVLTTEIPEKAGYHFLGWSTDPDAIVAEYPAGGRFTLNADTTLYAVWATGAHTLRFFVGDTLLQAGTFPKGYEVTPPPDPERLPDAVYNYTFAGWDKNGDGSPDILPGSKIVALENMDLIAVFDKTYIEYKVTFFGRGGEVVSERTYHYGELVELPEVQASIREGKYSYTFAGWNPEVSEIVTQNASYTAIFTESIALYRISFVDGDGNIMQSGEYEYGATITPPEEASRKSADKTFSYVFSRWDKDITEVTGDRVYTALFDCLYIDYSISFIDGDGNAVLEYAAHYGDAVTPPEETPAKSPDLMYEYIFSGWDREIGTVEGDTVYTAMFESVLRNYTVTFFNADGTVYHTAVYNYGDEIALPEDPAKSSSAGVYTFEGWTPDITPVTGNMNFTAKFDFSPDSKPGEDEKNSGFWPGTGVSIITVVIAAGGFVAYTIIRGRRAGHEEP